MARRKIRRNAKGFPILFAAVTLCAVLVMMLAHLGNISYSTPSIAGQQFAVASRPLKVPPPVDPCGDTVCAQDETYLSCPLDCELKMHLLWSDGQFPYDRKYAHYDGNQWQVQLLPFSNEVIFHHDLKLDHQGRPAILYSTHERRSGSTGSKLKLATLQSSGWMIEEVDYNRVQYSQFLFGTLAFDGQGNPAVAYSESKPPGGGDFALNYAKKRPSGWTIQRALEVDATPTCYNQFDPRRTGLVFDSSDDPKIVYMAKNLTEWPSTFQITFELRKAFYSSATGTWDIGVLDTVDQFSSVICNVVISPHKSIAIDPADNLHISYDAYFSGHPGLRYMQISPSGTTSVIDVPLLPANNYEGDKSAISLDNNQIPHFVHLGYPGTANNLVYTMLGQPSIASALSRKCRGVLTKMLPA